MTPTNRHDLPSPHHDDPENFTRTNSPHPAKPAYVEVKGAGSFSDLLAAVNLACGIEPGDPRRGSRAEAEPATRPAATAEEEEDEQEDNHGTVAPGTTSQRRIEANRRNAQKSTGPRTEAGKARSSMNAFKHGLTGQKIALERDQFVSYFTDAMAMLEDLRPVGIMEQKYAQKIIDFSWHMDVCNAWQLNMINIDAMEALERYPDNSEPHITGIIAETEAIRADCAGPRCLERVGVLGARAGKAMINYHNHLRMLQKERIQSAGKDVFDLANCTGYWVLKHQLEENQRLEAEMIAREEKAERERLERWAAARLAAEQAAEQAASQTQAQFQAQAEASIDEAATVVDPELGDTPHAPDGTRSAALASFCANAYEKVREMKLAKLAAQKEALHSPQSTPEGGENTGN